MGFPSYFATFIPGKKEACFGSAELGILMLIHLSGIWILLFIVFQICFKGW